MKMQLFCIQKESRTPIPKWALPPQSSVSTNSTTWTDGDPAGIRTQDPYIKSVLLYQLSYRIVQFVGEVYSFSLIAMQN